MGLVYLPTWMVDFYVKCRWIYQSHGSYGLRYGYSKGIKHVPFSCLCVFQRYQERTQNCCKYQSFKVPCCKSFACRKMHDNTPSTKKEGDTNSISHPCPGPFRLPFPSLPSQKKENPNSPDLILSVKGLEDLWLELRPRCQVGVSQENRFSQVDVQQNFQG